MNERLKKGIQDITRRATKFPVGPSTWPDTIAREASKSTLGVNYYSGWAKRPAAAWAQSLFHEAFGPLVSALAKPRVEGEDHLEWLDAPVIFVANHNSHVDTMLIIDSLPDRFSENLAVAAAADYFFDNRLKAALSALMIGAIPVDRARAFRQTIDNVEQAINDQKNLLIFPEGGRSPDGWGQPFQGGAAFISERLNVPIVPIYVGGTDRVLPKGARFPSPSQTVVSIGEALWQKEGESSASFTKRIEDTVAMLKDEEETDMYSARKRAARGETPSLRHPDGMPDWMARLTIADFRKKELPKSTWPRK